MVRKSRKKRRLIWDEEAKKQWRNILAFFVKRNGSMAYSRRLNIALRSLLELLRDNPEMGELTDKNGTRRFVVENYALFYRIGVDSIEVEAILDARRDPELLGLS